MKTIVLLFLILNVFVDCNSSGPTHPRSGLNMDSDTTKVPVKYLDSKIGTIDRADLIRKFDVFYKDKKGHFFIKSYGHQRVEGFEMKFVDVFIEIPELDSASYLNLDSYLKDDSKVICIYANSDGGNYVLLKDADPKTFQAFKSAFGGKDKNHVYYQAKKLPGLNPSAVKVYSTMRICSNCTAYFTDGKKCYLGDMESKSSKIPSEFDFVEE
jgi:hypothetical protein